MVNLLTFLKKQRKKNENNLEHKELLVETLNETKGKSDELNFILKDILDDTKSDQDIIDSIDSYINGQSIELKKVRDLKSGSDEYTLLHLSAENCRSKLCAYLIEDIQIDKDAKSKKKKTPIHVLVKANVFGKRQMKLPSSVEIDNNAIIDELKNLQIEETRLKFKNTFETLVTKEVNLNLQDDLGHTVTHQAVLENNYEAILQLTNLKNVNFNIQDNKKMTPLALACKLGHDQVGLLLLQRTSIESIIHAQNECLPLHLACKLKEEKFELVKSILDKLNSQKRLSTILTACYYNDIIKNDKNFNIYVNEAIKILDINGDNIFSILIANNHLNIIEYILKEFNEYLEDLVDKNNNLIIHLAAKNGSTDILKLLIKYNIFARSSNSNNENALHIAAANNKFNFIRDFLAYEKLLLDNEAEHKDNDSEEKAPMPCVNCLNKNQFTPLFVAINSGNLKCVEALTASNDLDLTIRGPNGNSIYHVCGELNNFEILRFLLTRKDSKFLEPLYIKNDNLDNIIHTACNYGNLEVARLVLSKINEGLISPEIYISMKNNNGYTSFLVACIKGYFNMVEYFLKDLKMKFCLEHLDDDSNNCLHLAALNGHLSLVSLLVEYGIDISKKNIDGYTALELSFKKGFFEIIKFLVSENNYNNVQEDTKHEYPLHVAAYEGSYEVIKLLLSKGVPINTLNSQNKNCLDVAIDRDQRECIKVLLKDKNWSQLIEISAVDRSFSFIKESTDLALASAINKLQPAIIENPQLNKMFQKKMWDSILLILDNCHQYDDYDFSKLDPPLKEIATHPLMLLAQSGQETLLKHPTVQKLLALKWRFIPRFAFYSNLFFYLLFLIGFSIFSIKLSNHINDKSTQNSTSSNGASNVIPLFSPKVVLFAIKGAASSINNNENDDDSSEYVDFENRNLSDISRYSNISIFVIAIIVINLIKNVFQVILVDKLSYFNSLENFLEVFTFIFALIGILSNHFLTKLMFSSVAILSSFIVFTFLIQKLRGFGLYVLAFRRTLSNSTKFFPIFLLVFIGFNLSFRLQTQFKTSNRGISEGGLIIKTFIMVLGGLETDEMGLDQSALVNLIIYFFFISIVCVILVNLFVGIAVGEITTVLNEADVQQISMRIIFVLKVQESLKPFIRGDLTKKYFDLQFQDYKQDNEYVFLKKINNIIEYFSNKFSSVEPSIELVDPQQKLEESLVELSRTTQTDLKSIRESLAHQINDVEHKLANSQQRIEDCLVEMNTKTTTNFETTKEESSDSIAVVEAKLENLTKKVIDNFFGSNCLLKTLFNAIRQSIKSLMFNLCNKLITNQNRIEGKLDTLISICKETHSFSDHEFVNVKQALNQANKHFDEISKRLDEMMSKIRELEQKHHFQIEKELEIFHISYESKEKLNEQKLILDEIAKFKFPTLPQPKQPSPPPPPPPPPSKKDIDDGIKRTIRRFDQPTLSQISKTTKAKATLQPPNKDMTRMTSRTSSPNISPAVSASSLASAHHGASVLTSSHDSSADSAGATATKKKSKSDEGKE